MKKETLLEIILGTVGGIIFACRYVYVFNSRMEFI